MFAEVLQKFNWVFYGLDNLLPQYFIDLYDNCAIHKAVVTSKVNQILGDGIVSEDNPSAVIDLVNPKQDITDIIKRCTLDFILFGGYCVNVIWSRDRKSISEIYHVDFSRIRSGKISVLTDEVYCYYYSPNWKDTKKYPPIEIKSFNPNEEDPSQLFYFKTYMPSMSYYPVPDWSAGQRAIEIDIETKNFHMNNLRKGMVPSL